MVELAQGPRRGIHAHGQAHGRDDAREGGTARGRGEWDDYGDDEASASSEETILKKFCSPRPGAVFKSGSVEAKGKTSENNVLENFDLSDEDTPELFNSGANEELSTSSEETVLEQDEDLEIPAFLRRQKN